MDEMLTCKAYAKINLTLDVGPKRADGFHPVRMLMQTIDLYDEIELKRSHEAEKRILVRCDAASLPADESNLAFKAAKVFLEAMEEETGLSEKEGIEIRIRKHIPIGAGLAGGSADAAAVLKGMNLLFGKRFSQEELVRMGASFGSDIPFCLTGGTCLATGRGETVEPVEPMPEAFVLLIKPAFSVSTPQAYARFDSLHPEGHPDVEAMREAFRRQDLFEAAGQLKNLLEPGVIADHPLVAELKAAVRSAGALGSLMSGSGPTVFGLFENGETAEAAACALRKQYPEAEMIGCYRLFQPN